MAGFILNLEELSVSSRVFMTSTIVVLFLVVLDKRIMFSRVIGIEHMLRMKKFSTSDIHFNLTIWGPICIFGLLMGLFNTISLIKDQKSRGVSINN